MIPFDRHGIVLVKFTRVCESCEYFIPMDWFTPPRNTWIFQRYSIQHSLPVDQRIRPLPSNRSYYSWFHEFSFSSGLERLLVTSAECGRMRGRGLFEVVDRRNGNEFFIKKAVSGERTVERDGKEEKKRRKKKIYIYREIRRGRERGRGGPVTFDVTTTDLASPFLLSWQEWRRRDQVTDNTEPSTVSRMRKNRPLQSRPPIIRGGFVSRWKIKRDFRESRRS